jgi:hypothetical protein
LSILITGCLIKKEAQASQLLYGPRLKVGRGEQPQQNVNRKVGIFCLKLSPLGREVYPERSRGKGRGGASKQKRLHESVVFFCTQYLLQIKICIFNKLTKNQYFHDRIFQKNTQKTCR